MAEDDQLVVTIEEEVIEPEAGETVVKAETDKVEKQAEPAVADLAEQYKEMEALAERRRLAADRARREASELRKENTALRSDSLNSRLDTVSTALESAQAEAERAKRDIKAAVEIGDADAQADAYDRMSTAKAAIIRLEETKADIEARGKEQPEPRRRKAEPEAEAEADPVEAYIQGRSPQTAEWLRKHPDYVTDQRKNTKLTAAHFDAVGEGIDPDTPEYFAHVEQFVGIKKPNGAEPKPEPARQERKAAAPPVAPGASVASPGGGSNTPSVKLSAAEARSATDGTIVWNYTDPKRGIVKGEPVGIQEFARRKLKLTEMGAYDK